MPDDLVVFDADSADRIARVVQAVEANPRAPRQSAIRNQGVNPEQALRVTGAGIADVVEAGVFSTRYPGKVLDTADGTDLGSCWIEEINGAALLARKYKGRLSGLRSDDNLPIFLVDKNGWGDCGCQPPANDCWPRCWKEVARFPNPNPVVPWPPPEDAPPNGCVGCWETCIRYRLVCRETGEDPAPTPIYFEQCHWNAPPPGEICGAGTTPPPPDTFCPPGYHLVNGECVPGDVLPPPQPCEPGFYWDHATSSCQPIGGGGGGGWPPQPPPLPLPPPGGIYCNGQWICDGTGSVNGCWCQTMPGAAPQLLPLLHRDLQMYVEQLWSGGTVGDVLTVQAGGSIAAAASAPAASGTSGFTASEATLGNAVLTLRSTATNDDPEIVAYQGRVTTTGGATTAIHTLTLADNTAYLVKALVIGRRTGGSSGTAGDMIIQQIAGAFYRVAAGSATQVGTTQTVFQVRSNANTSVTFTVPVDSNDVQVTVAGDFQNDYVWHLSALEVSKVST